MTPFPEAIILTSLSMVLERKALCLPGAGESCHVSDFDHLRLRIMILARFSAENLLDSGIAPQMLFGYAPRGIPCFLMGESSMVSLFASFWRTLSTNLRFVH